MDYKRNLVPQMSTEGWHFAEITMVKEGKPVNTKLGVSETALMNFVTETHCLVTQSFLMAPGVNFTLEKLIDITIGEGDEQVNLENLVGKRCGIKVEHRLWNSRVFANVVDVCSIEELVEDESDNSVPPTEVITDLDDFELN